RVDVFATGMGNPRMMAVAPDGGVYITRPRTGDVVLLRDRDGDGRADEQSVVVSGIEGVHGIALHQVRAYIAAQTAVYVEVVRGDGRLGTPRTLIADLPDGGQ